MNFFALLDGVESDLEDDIDERFRHRVHSFKRRILKKRTFPMINLKTFGGENPKDSEEESQEDRVDVSEAKEKLRGQSKEKEKGKGK